MTDIRKQQVIAGIVMVAMLGIAALSMQAARVRAADWPQQSVQSPAYASSTAFALTAGLPYGAIIGTSTARVATGALPATVGRTAFAVQSVNCATGSTIWLSFNDTAAATTTGYFLNASSTVTFGDTVPAVYGSVRAVATGNCSLLVTEFRSTK